MTIDEYWSKVRTLGLRNPQRGSPNVDYIATTLAGYPAEVPDPERLSPEQREFMIEVLRMRHKGFDS